MAFFCFAFLSSSLGVIDGTGRIVSTCADDVVLIFLMSFFVFFLFARTNRPISPSITPKAAREATSDRAVVLVRTDASKPGGLQS